MSLSDSRLTKNDYFVADLVGGSRSGDTNDVAKTTFFVKMLCRNEVGVSGVTSPPKRRIIALSPFPSIV